MDERTLNPQTGMLSRTAGKAARLSSDDMAALYWIALGAPDQHAAASIGITVAAFLDLRADLAARLDLNVPDLGGLDLTLANGDWPRSDVPWSQRHAVTLIEHGLDRPDDEVIARVAGEGAMTVAEVRAIVSRIRVGLESAGVRHGTLVALDATQRIEVFLLAMAILLQGAAIVRIGDNLPDKTMRDMLRACPVRMTFSAHIAALGALAEAGPCVDLDVSGAAYPGFGDWVAGCPDTDPPEPASVRPDALALVGFTSGSTGRPMRVLNTHQAVWRTTEVALRRFGFGAGDVFCSATDVVAMSGFRSMLTLPLKSGGKVLFLSPEARSTPLAQALECQEHGVTCLTAVPNVLRSFVKAGHLLQEDQFGKLRLVLSGSGVLDVPTAQAFFGRFGVPVIDYYGKREIGTVLYSADDQATTVGTGGARAAEALIRILDLNQQPVLPGDVGELHVMTDSAALQDVAQGADGGDASLHSASAVGWHATGDLGRVTADGRIVIAGRSSDAIKAPDGQLVLPQEVEAVLGWHPMVLESCAFSVFRPDGLECVGASVILRDHAAEIDEALENDLRWHVRNALGAYKTPERILVMPDFPRVGRSKPDRGALRHAYAALLPAGDRRK